MSGFGVAYDAVVRTSLAQERSSYKREVRHQARSQRYHDQMMLHIIARDRKLDRVESIQAALESDSLEESGRVCPECGGPFMLVETAKVEVDVCLSCGSFWLDQGEMKVLTHRVADMQSQQGPVAPSKFNCPVCQKSMEQYRFLTHNDLLVDKCPDGHGLYLERDELVRAIEL